MTDPPEDFDPFDENSYEPLAPAGDSSPPAEPPQAEDPGPCPVVPLGCREGVYFYLSPSGELRVLPARGHTATGIASIFDGNGVWLRGAFPRRGDQGRVIGWDTQSVAERMMATATKAGYFDLTKARGVGAWRLRDRRLIVHSGDRLLLPGDVVPEGADVEPAAFPKGYVWIPAGRRIEGHIYPTAEPLPRPADVPATANDVRALMAFLDTWGWGHPPAAARLLLGWICCAMVAGALRWRPHVWVTGSSGGGKSTLEDLIKEELGNSIFPASSPTEYGIREGLRGAAIPVMLDEVEGEPDDEKKIRALVNLAKLASSENQSAIVKGAGGAEGGVKQWPIRGMFYFTSVIHVNMRAEDRSRISVLDLVDLPTGDDADFDRRFREFAAMGPALRARVLAVWDRFEEAFMIYKGQLAQLGRTKRQADQIGTLLAMADVMTSDQPVDEAAVREIVDTFDIDDFTGHEEDQDQFECMTRLLTWPFTIHHHDGSYRAPLDAVLPELTTQPQHYYLRSMRVIGVTVKKHRPPPSADNPHPAEELCLVVPNKHVGLETVFENTRWARGGWAQSLGRYPGGFPLKTTVTIGGRENTSRAKAFPLSFLPFERETKPATDGVGGDEV